MARIFSILMVATGLTLTGCGGSKSSDSPNPAQMKITEKGQTVSVSLVDPQAKKK